MNVHSKVGGFTVSSREFNQNTAHAKAAADQGPVIVTDRGRPAYVLLTFADYERLRRPRRSIAEALADPSPDADFDYDFERAPGGPRKVDLG